MVEWPGTWRPGVACREPVKTGSKPYAGARAWSEPARRAGAGESSTGCRRGRGRKARGQAGIPLALSSADLGGRSARHPAIPAPSGSPLLVTGYARTLAGG